MTFAQARTNLQAYLLGLGWKMSDPFKVSKVPYITSPNKLARLWFKPQAVYYSYGNAHTLGDARSLHVDIRTESPENVLAWMMKLENMRSATSPW